MTKFIKDQPVTLEETRLYEFKEIKGANPINSIKNTCDEYVVAFLNRNGGSIFWGIRDDDRTVVGIDLSYQDRDKLRKEITNKIHTIKPSISPSGYQINFHEVVNGNQKVLDNCYVLEIVVFESIDNVLYSTDSNNVFIKTDSGKKKLTIPEIRDEILRREQLRNRDFESIKSELHVGIGDDEGIGDEVVIGIQNFYSDSDITDMFVQVTHIAVSKFTGDDYYKKISKLSRSELFFDGRHIGKSLNWITNNSTREKIVLKPNETADFLLLENLSDKQNLHFGFGAFNITDEMKKSWREDGTYEISLDVYGKVYNEVKYRKMPFVVLVQFRKGWGIEVERCIAEKFYQKWFEK